MGQQTSRKSNRIYFHQKIPSFLSVKRPAKTEKLEEPIKFQYQLTKTNTKKHKNKINNFDNFGFSTINNLKNVLDGVKSECTGLKECAVNGSKDVNNSEACKKFLNQSSDELSSKAHKNLVISADRTLHVLRLKAENCSFVENIPKNNNSKNPTRRTREQRNNNKIKNVPSRTKSEPSLRSDRERKRSRPKRSDGGTNHRNETIQQFGYEIQDVDTFLAKATLSKPANIPVVLAFPSVLYQTRVGGYQAEISLPLGMVVNAIFKNQNWLYVQTPHAEEGYVSYSECLPLGIIPPRDDDKLSPCWEKSTDIFPKPSGNMTDTEKLSCKSETEEDSYCPSTRYRTAHSTCGEKSVDRLYLRAAAISKGKGTRHTLLVINEDYDGIGKESFSVLKNEVVFLLNASIKGWFYVRNKEGREGFIPAVVAGHGFL